MRRLRQDRRLMRARRGWIEWGLRLLETDPTPYAPFPKRLRAPLA